MDILECRESNKHNPSPCNTEITPGNIAGNIFQSSFLCMWEGVSVCGKKQVCLSFLYPKHLAHVKLNPCKGKTFSK